MLYDSSSLIASLVASGTAAFFRTKLFLRKKHVNSLYRKWLYTLKHRKIDEIDFSKLKINYVDTLENEANLQEMDLALSENEFFKKFLYSFLFLNPEHHTHVQCYRVINEDVFFIKGKEKVQKIVIGK